MHGGAPVTACERIPEHDFAPRNPPPQARMRDVARRPVYSHESVDTTDDPEGAQTVQEQVEARREKKAQGRHRESLLVGQRSGALSAWDASEPLPNNDPTGAIMPARMTGPPVEHMSIAAASPNNPPIFAIVGL